MADVLCVALGSRCSEAWFQPLLRSFFPSIEPVLGARGARSTAGFESVVHTVPGGESTYSWVGPSCCASRIALKQAMKGLGKFTTRFTCLLSLALRFLPDC